MQRNLIVPEGWSIQSIKFHRDFIYWSLWALNFLSSLMPSVNPTPPAADVSYTLRRDKDGAVETVRLNGDHTPDALAKTMLLTEADRGTRHIADSRKRQRAFARQSHITRACSLS